MDKIFIQNLHMVGILGVNPEEQRTPQEILVSTVISTDIRKAAQLDDINQTIDYSKLSKEIIRFVETSRYYTIEALIEALATMILNNEDVVDVRIKIVKPDAVSRAEAVGVEIFRSREP